MRDSRRLLTASWTINSQTALECICETIFISFNHQQKFISLVSSDHVFNLLSFNYSTWLTNFSSIWVPHYPNDDLISEIFSLFCGFFHCINLICITNTKLSSKSNHSHHLFGLFYLFTVFLSSFPVTILIIIKFKKILQFESTMEAFFSNFMDLHVVMFWSKTYDSETLLMSWVEVEQRLGEI